MALLCTTPVTFAPRLPLMVVAPEPVPELVISPVGLTRGAETVNAFALFALKVTLPAFKTLPLTVKAPVPLFVKERLPVFV